MKKYYNLEYVFNNCFSYELEVDRETGIKWVKEAIADNEVDMVKLRIEIEDIFLDDNFNLVEFAYKNNLIEDYNSFSRQDIKQIILYGLSGIVFPEKVKNYNEIQRFLNAILEILKTHTENDGWLLRRDLYGKLIKLEEFKEFEEFHLFGVHSISNHTIQNRFEFGKGEQRVFLKLIK
jgi:hypothetical protein